MNDENEESRVGKDEKNEKDSSRTKRQTSHAAHGNAPLPTGSPESIGRAIATEEILATLQSAANAGPFMVSIWWEDKKRVHAYRRTNNFSTREYARSIALLLVDLERSHDGNLLAEVAKIAKEVRKQNKLLSPE